MAPKNWCLGPKYHLKIKHVFFGKLHFLDVFQLRNGFWTLPDGPLDPLDRYKNPKKKLNLFDFFQKYNLIKIRRIIVQFCNTIWTNLFAQNPKKIYKRNQDETKRAIMSFKESNNGL